MTERFVKNEVVTRNAIIDWFQGLRHLFGWRLRAYEDTLQQTQEKLIAEAEEEYDIHWFRVDITSMTSQSAIITIYGEGEPR